MKAVFMYLSICLGYWQSRGGSEIAFQGDGEGESFEARAATTNNKRCKGEEQRRAKKT